MNGRAKIHGDEQRLDDTFKRAARVDPEDLELQADFARHLCVLISGFLEQAVIEVLLEHARQQSSPSVQRFVGAKLGRFTTANTKNVTDLVGSFDSDWHKDLTTYLVDERKDAIDSVVATRHNVAHGRSVGVTMRRAIDYYAQVKEVVEHITNLCLAP